MTQQEVEHWMGYYAAQFGHPVAKDARTVWELELQTAKIGPAMKAVDVFMAQRENHRELMSLALWRGYYKRACGREEARARDAVAANSCGQCWPPGWKRLVYGGADMFHTPDLVGDDEPAGGHPYYAIRGIFCGCPAGDGEYARWHEEKQRQMVCCETPDEIARLRPLGMTVAAAVARYEALTGRKLAPTSFERGAKENPEKARRPPPRDWTTFEAVVEQEQWWQK